MDRFLLAENPRNLKAGVAIIHTIDPVAIIGVIEGHHQRGQHFRHFSYGNEQFTLYIHHLFTTNMNAADDEQASIIADKLLKRAWHWYESYLEWEDQNEEESKI